MFLQIIFLNVMLKQPADGTNHHHHITGNALHICQQPFAFRFGQVLDHINAKAGIERFVWKVFVNFPDVSVD